MNLNFFLDPREAEGHPGKIFLVSFFYTILAILVSTLLSPSYASLLMILFAVVALVPLFYNIITLETARAQRSKKEVSLLREHVKAITFLLTLFLGMVGGYLGGYLFAPGQGLLFSAQIETINHINIVTGNFISALPEATGFFLLNLRLLVLTTVLSMLFGVGALLIFSWNASVISAAVGQFIEGLGGVSLSTVSLGLIRYLLHGTLEMTSYFLGALAGSIVFVEILTWKQKKDGLDHLPAVAKDVGVLFFLGVVLLYISAVVEVAIHSAF